MTDKTDPAPIATDDLLEHLSLAARSLRRDGDEGLTAIVDQAALTVPAATWAGLIELEHGRPVPRATLGEPPRVLDRLQQELSNGPCIDAAREQTVIVIEDMGTDRRWPAFAAAAVRCRVLSMLCVPLWVESLRLGTLSLYATSEHAFGAPDRRLASVYATLAALALADRRRAAQLMLALESRDAIGQAKGVLIERFGIGPDAAFGMLAKLSQDRNEKLVEVARQVVDTAGTEGHRKA